LKINKLDLERKCERLEKKFKESDKNSFKEQIKPIIYKFFEAFLSNK